MKGMTNAQKDTSDLATNATVATKADQSALDATNAEVSKKANQSDLVALQNNSAPKTCFNGVEVQDKQLIFTAADGTQTVVDIPRTGPTILRLNTEFNADIYFYNISSGTDYISFTPINSWKLQGDILYLYRSTVSLGSTASTRYYSNYYMPNDNKNSALQEAIKNAIINLIPDDHTYRISFQIANADNDLATATGSGNKFSATRTPDGVNFTVIPSSACGIYTRSRLSYDMSGTHNMNIRLIISSISYS